MRTKNLIVTTVVFVFSIMGVYAQKLEAALVDGLPVINCSGMPAAAITTNSKGSTAAELRTVAANATVFHRFAVAINDNGTASTWLPAFTVCSNLGAGWRMPTQRELMLMFVLKKELEDASGSFTKFDLTDSYWCSTSLTNTSNSSWIMNFSEYEITTMPQTAPYRFRCVKEL